MTYLIGAAGTGGHVFPGLAVGEALMELGVAQSSITFVGGDRLEARVFPEHGFRFVQVELAGLQRSITAKNLKIPRVVRSARREILNEIESANTAAVLGMGGYVTVPIALAARRAQIPLFVAEQNATAGLANRFASLWATERFVAFPSTRGLESGIWVGNPVRRAFWEFARERLKLEALSHFDLAEQRPTLGVYGGSLGSLAINTAVAEMTATWVGQPFQVIHLTGEGHIETLSQLKPAPSVVWRRRAFEPRMELFFAASSLVVARGGGGVAEIVATATPSILIPGDFGSSGHQEENCRFLAKQQVARVLPQSELGTLGQVVEDLLFDRARLRLMAEATQAIAKPRAAISIAKAMIGAAE